MSANHAKEKPRWRIKVTSSLNEISMDQLGNRVVVTGEALPWALLTTLFYTRHLDRYLKTTVNVCSSTGEIFASWL
jgi:hypothetical protein